MRLAISSVSQISNSTKESQISTNDINTICISMKYYCGMTLYFKEYWARLMAKAYIWQTLGVSIRNEFPSVRDVLETKETVEVRFKDGNSLESQLKARDFYQKLEKAGIERSKYFNGVGIETFIFKRDRSIAISANGIHYQKNERD